MTYGPQPWQQTHWDARAAGNFIGGGAGSGLLVAAVAAGSTGNLRTLSIALSIALIGGGLACVWAEIGRPWRALHVLFNPRTSWMSREAALAPLLLGSAALGLIGAAPLRAGTAWLSPLAIDAALLLAALAALAFLYCQARILRAARAIAAWRVPLIVPLIVTSGLAEGAGLFALLAALWGRASGATCFALAVLLALRIVSGIAWRRRVARELSGPAQRSLGHCRIAARIAGPLPLALAFAALLHPLAPGWVGTLQLLAGVFALIGGAWFKFALITRCAFNQGFALPHLPVRGVRRSSMAEHAR